MIIGIRKQPQKRDPNVDNLEQAPQMSNRVTELTERDAAKPSQTVGGASSGGPSPSAISAACFSED